MKRRFFKYIAILLVTFVIAPTILTAQDSIATTTDSVRSLRELLHQS